MNTEKKLWIVSNGKDKAILINATDSDNARKLANYHYYSPFPSKKDLNITQGYCEHNHMKHKVFRKVQFHSMGGVTTTYDATINTKPTQQQIDFLGREIEYVKLTDDKY
jgi:hypothetical protein